MEEPRESWLRVVIEIEIDDVYSRGNDTNEDITYFSITFRKAFACIFAST